MLTLSRKVDYAIQFITELVDLKKGETLSLKEFAEKSAISFSFMQLIARELKKANIVNALKGKNGGYMLAIDPGQLTVYDIVSAVEGEHAIATCISNPGSCGLESVCKGKNIIEILNFEISDLLKSVTAADF